MDNLHCDTSKVISTTRYSKPKCVLVIDDDPLARQVLRLIIESEGYLCREAENGALGLAMFTQFRPDLVITDHNMPVLTGIEFLERLSQQNQRRIPAVIVVTGNPTHEIKSRALQSGARAVLAKPYDIGELRAMTTWLLNSEQSIHIGEPVTTN